MARKETAKSKFRYGHSPRLLLHGIINDVVITRLKIISEATLEFELELNTEN